ncbi:hypothetical protein DYBT9623_01524 [Dyadobacter sp. CECT 9623]|uniref:Secretion system C-terminal sorting domain-containing protein n=1 Tax=Dyadobacter linearis TaxID=2823330 RepID=A0ABN7R8M5_9BACT|nr:T9SS type A sorting domain-containing protein [Dyadobacter sp. CECT 9623]CAG5068792.1 hypothetical protein DYBT9623_01524 [Dyadobacter sp. CECT 9623]
MRPLLVLHCIFVISARVLAQSGTLDPTFGNGGKVITDIDHFRNATNSAVIQPDGKLVVVGYSSEFPQTGYFCIMRYNVDGSLDLSFGQDGIVRTILGPDEDWAYAAVLQPDGKIIAAGYSWSGTSYDFAMVRYTRDGTKDLTFGSGGIVTSDFDGRNEKANVILLRPDGKILLAGVIDEAATFDKDMVVAQYEANGNLDIDFGVNGVSVIKTGDVGLWQSVRAAALQNDGKLVLAGYSEVWVNNFQELNDVILVGRLNGSGLLDNSFGESGFVKTAIGKRDVGTSVAIQKDNKILILGKTQKVKISGYPDMALLRYDSNGNLDNSFGTSGIVITTFENSDDEGYALALQSDDKILAAGFTAKNNGSTTDFAIARFHPNGTLDVSFGTTGKVSIDISGDLDFGSLVVLQKNGKIILGGYSKIGNDYDISLVRLLNDVALPVKLQYFEVSKADNEISLNWKTTFEENFDHFDIQKSRDAKTWVDVGTQAAASTLDSTATYEFIDREAGQGRLYYRLKMVDSDNTFAYSAIRSILHSELAGQILIYPNPASDQIFIKSDFNLPEKVTFLNSVGKKFSLVKSPDNFVDISSLDSGLYTIIIDRKIEKSATKLLIFR